VFLGYDTPPLTVIGKFLGIIITLLGLGWIALPISIISSGFIEEIGKGKNGHENCEKGEHNGKHPSKGNGSVQG